MNKLSNIVGNNDDHQKFENSEAKQLNEEEMKKTEKFILELQRLQETDPEGFKTLLKAMGVTDDSPNPSYSTSSIINAISSLRNSNGDLPEINLPDGASKLGADGLKPKVYHSI
jgi:hypothetical protein